MATCTIKPLPDIEAAQIKSSLLITSLQDVAIGLIDNSLDSDATKVNVEIDFEWGFCAVEDNGTGIATVDFSESGGLAKVHRE